MVGYSKRTVDKRLKYLADQSAKAHDEAIAEKKFETSYVQVDEMETYEHTRCKPLSIAMAVRHKTGEILGVEVAKMPAKGLLAKVGKTKYKWTSDERERAFKKLMRRISPCIKPTITFKSDSHKRYTGWITDIFPHAMHEKHKRVKTPKGSPKPFDPLFKVNTPVPKCAMTLQGSPGRNGLPPRVKIPCKITCGYTSLGLMGIKSNRME